MAEFTTAMANAPSRKAFASMFKARWQNLQNIINDSVFASMYPEPYLTYYNAYIKQWLQWSTGFVPMLHRNDFFATGMGYTVCDIFSRECMNGGFRLDSINEESKNFMETWSADTDLSSIFTKMFFFSNAGGNAILCLTPVCGEVFPSVIPINRIVFQIGRRGNITQAVIFNRFAAGKDIYYAKEYRAMFNGKAYYKVLLGKGTLAMSPSWNSSTEKKVNKKIESQWEYAYGNIVPNEWYEFPEKLKNLGLYNIRNKAVAVALADMPGYSDSSLHTALDILYSIDFNYTQQQVDQYLGKGRALVPKQMQKLPAINGNQSNVMVQNGVSFVEAMNQPQLDDTFYLEIASSGANGEPIKPFFIQPDLRGEARKYLRDADLEILASKVGLSSSTLANHLQYNSSKTATEVRAEQDTTETSVNTKRALANEQINKMLSDAACFYGYDEKVEINWGRAGVNSSTENAELLSDYQAGTLSLKDYLRKRWSDLTEQEVDFKAAELVREQKEKAFGQAFFDNSNYYDDGVTENARNQESSSTTS